MKKLLFMIPLLITLAMSAQPTGSVDAAIGFSNANSRYSVMCAVKNIIPHWGIYVVSHGNRSGELGPNSSGVNLSSSPNVVRQDHYVALENTTPTGWGGGITYTPPFSNRLNGFIGMSIMRHKVYRWDTYYYYSSQGWIGTYQKMTVEKKIYPAADIGIDFSISNPAKWRCTWGPRILYNTKVGMEYYFFLGMSGKKKD